MFDLPAASDHTGGMGPGAAVLQMAQARFPVTVSVERAILWSPVQSSGPLGYPSHTELRDGVADSEYQALFQSLYFKLRNLSLGGYY